MRVEAWISNGGSSAERLGLTPSPVTRERVGERELLTLKVKGNSLRSPPHPPLRSGLSRRERRKVVFASC